MLEPLLFDNLKLAQNGDRQALDRFLAVLRPHLEEMAHHYAQASCSSESTADLVQESVLRVWQRLHQFRGEKDNEQTARMFWDWMSQIVRHLAFDKQREQNAQRRKPPQRILRLGQAGASETTSD